MWEWEEGLSSRPCEKGASFEVGVVLLIRDLPLGPPMDDATFPSDHGENSSCLVKSIEGAIVTASCTTGVRYWGRREGEALSRVVGRELALLAWERRYLLSEAKTL